MADKLTAAQFNNFGTRNIRSRVVRTATINNDSISLVDITDKVKKWGKLGTELYNKNPNEKGRLRFPVVTVEVDNSEGYFSRGGVIFPAGNADYSSTVLRISVVIDGTTFLDFTGMIKEPEYDDSKELRLVAEHPLAASTLRKWRRADRIGGDTGINKTFGS